MRSSLLLGAMCLSVAVLVSCASANGGGSGASLSGNGTGTTEDASGAHPNLVAFVGRRLSVQHVEPEGGKLLFDAEFRVRVEVLHVVFGRYPSKEMEFSSYVHTGEPAFGQHEFGMVYVSKYEGRLVQQKYLFQPVYPTSDGRFASCGDPYERMPDVHRHGVRAQAITFKPSVTFDVRKEDRRFRSFQDPFFRVENNVATCLMGNYPRELFQVMAEGYLRARGVFERPSD